EALENKQDITKIKNLWIKKNGRVYRNPARPFIENLDDLPFPDRELFPYQSVIDSDFGTALFMFTRGCPYNCSYCSNDALRRIQEGKYVRFRSVDGCIQEIKEVISNYKVKSLYFNDDIFTLNKEFVFEFCEKYKAQIHLPFDINARVETISKGICRELRKAGCRRINIGIESGNPYIRNKVLNRKMSNEQIVSAFSVARQAGLKTKSFNMVGFPYETAQHFQDTVKLNAEIKPDSVILNIFDPYPGTKLGIECGKKGWVDFKKMGKEFVPRTDTILNLPGFPREKILKCYKEFAYNVYRDQSLVKGIFYRIYYSSHGEQLVRILAPFKRVLRRLAMGI
ncbi:radical SAM protein, partial [Candidatus Aerophobetes bacterium]|nr:radical SAM protein [Candidatus Aerophobetes bacterium]